MLKDAIYTRENIEWKSFKMQFTTLQNMDRQENVCSFRRVQRGK